MKRAAILLLVVLAMTVVPAQAAFRGGNGPLVTAAGERLWLYQNDGSVLKELRIKGARTPDMAPDSRWIVFAKRGDLAKVRRDGSRFRWLTNDEALQEMPSWGPDGHHILFIEEGGIYEMEADGSDATRIGSSSGQDAEWSPDGSQIAYVGCSLPCVTPDIYVMNSDGSGASVVAVTQDHSERTVDWSPDGSRLVAQCGAPSRNAGLGEIPPSDICVYSMDVGEVEVIYAGDLRAASPTWAPSGRKIAFVAKPPGEDDFEVFTIKPDGSQLTRLTYNGHKDLTPDWGPR